jgi:hypothetical protein
MAMMRQPGVGPVDSDASRETTAEAKARSEAGVMSYFKTILDMRLDYTDWLTRRGAELPARLKTPAGAMVGFETGVREACGDRRFAIRDR